MSKIIKCPKCGSFKLFGVATINPIVPVKLNWESVKIEGKTLRSIKAKVSLCKVRDRELKAVELVKSTTTNVDPLQPIKCIECNTSFTIAELDRISNTNEGVVTTPTKEEVRA